MYPIQADGEWVGCLAAASHGQVGEVDGPYSARTLRHDRDWHGFNQSVARQQNVWYLISSIIIGACNFIISNDKHMYISVYTVPQSKVKFVLTSRIAH